MSYSIKNREDSKNLSELVSLNSQVKAVRLQGKKGKQNFHEDMKKNFQLMTDIMKNVSNKLTKTITETSIKNNIALSNLNEKVLETLNEKDMIALY